MESSEYKFLVEISDLLSSLLPYFVHFIVAVFQGVLALQLLLWSKRILFPKKNAAPMTVGIHSKTNGIVLLVAGLCLLLPLLLGAHYWVSGAALVTAALYGLSIVLSKKMKVQFKKYSITLISLGVLCFMFWEKADPLKQSVYVCFKALKWRIYESSWQEIHDKTAPKIGEMAPDFELVSADLKDTVRLSDYRNNKPVALIFGSHTCPPHSDGTKILKELQKRYKNKVAFISVYLKEAHPTDKWWLGETRTQQAIFDWTKTVGRRNLDEPETLQARRRAASNYRQQLYDNQLPIYVDTMDDQVGELYAAKPTRLYLIDKEGKVIYNPGFGPMSFNPKKLEEEIEKYLKE